MRIGAHAARSCRRELLEPRNQSAAGVEELIGLLVPHPLFEDAQLFRILFHIRQRDLVGTPKAFEPVASHLFWRTPSLRRTDHDHGPARPARDSSSSAFLLDFADLLHTMLDRGSHGLMHCFGIRSFDKERGPTIPPKQAF